MLSFWLHCLSFLNGYISQLSELLVSLNQRQTFLYRGSPEESRSLSVVSPAILNFCRYTMLIRWFFRLSANWCLASAFNNARMFHVAMRQPVFAIIWVFIPTVTRVYPLHLLALSKLYPQRQPSTDPLIHSIAYKTAS